MNKFYTSTEAAHFLNCDQNVIRLLALQGAFPNMHRKASGKIYQIPIEDLIAVQAMRKAEKEKRLQKIADNRKHRRWLMSDGNFEIGEMFDGNFKCYITCNKRDAALVYRYLLTVGALSRVFKDGERLLIHEADDALSHEILHPREIKKAKCLLRKGT